MGLGSSIQQHLQTEQQWLRRLEGCQQIPASSHPAWQLGQPLPPWLADPASEALAQQLEAAVEAHLLVQQGLRENYPLLWLYWQGDSADADGELRAWAQGLRQGGEDWRRTRGAEARMLLRLGLLQPPGAEAVSRREYQLDFQLLGEPVRLQLRCWRRLRSWCYAYRLEPQQAQRLAAHLERIADSGQRPQERQALQAQMLTLQPQLARSLEAAQLAHARLAARSQALELQWLDQLGGVTDADQRVRQQLETGPQLYATEDAAEALTAAGR